MSKIFFISGLGANELAFSKLGEVGLEKVLVQWLPSEGDESLNTYAKRLIAANNIGKNDVVAGLSFGGLLAQEITNILDHDKVILISSFRNTNDLKPVFKYALRMGLHWMMPSVRIPIIDEYIAKALNSNTEGSLGALKEMLKTTDYVLMSWSLRKIADERITNNEHKIVHNIMGNDDNIISLWGNRYTRIVEGGSHFMVYEMADEVTEIIKDILSVITIS